MYKNSEYPHPLGWGALVIMLGELGASSYFGVFRELGQKSKKKISPKWKSLHFKCFFKFLWLLSSYNSQWSVALPQGAMGWSTVCDCVFS